MEDIIKKSIGKLIVLISIIDPNNLIIGKLKEVGKDYVILEKSIWYRKDNLYTLISLLSNMYRHIFGQVLRIRVGNNQQLMEETIVKEIDTVMNDIVDKTLNSITPEVLPSFIFKPLNKKDSDIVLNYNNFIFVNIDNVIDENTEKFINDYIKAFYGMDNNTKENIISDQTGNA